MRFFATAVAIALAAAVASAAQDTPVPPLAGTVERDVQTVGGPLELKPATADSEAVLAGLGYLRRTYARQPGITNTAFAVMYREWFIANGWRVVDSPRLPDPAIESEAVSIAATNTANGQLLFAVVRSDTDAYTISVADVGAEDWGAALDAQCHLPIYGIDFDLERPTLRPEATPFLQKLAAMLVALKGTRVEVQGHLDNRGDDSSPASLSEARARSVAAWLIAHGVPPGMLSTKGLGRSRPVMENDSDLGRAMNRRIEIVQDGCRR
jgi:OmpA-OmpF porin, OOP family